MRTKPKVPVQPQSVATPLDRLRQELKDVSEQRGEIGDEQFSHLWEAALAAGLNVRHLGQYVAYAGNPDAWSLQLPHKNVRKLVMIDIRVSLHAMLPGKPV